MAFDRIACFVSVLVLIAANPSQPPPAVDQQPSADSQQPSAGSQQPAASRQPSAAEQLSALLGPVVEGAVSRAQAGWRLAQLAGRLEQLQAGAGQRQLAELTRQQARLDSVIAELAALRLLVLTGGGRAGRTESGSQTRAGPAGVCQPSPPEPTLEHEHTAVGELSSTAERGTAGGTSDTDPAPEVEPTPAAAPGDPAGSSSPQPESPPAPERLQEANQEPTCQEQPAALPSEAATYQEPAERACARSCLQLQSRGVTQDGVYWLTGLPVPVMCDFSHDGGGWTLLLTAVSRRGWDPLSVLERSRLAPSLTDDYSILRYGDALRDLGGGGRFAYRIESQAERGRQRWGGVWFAPGHYSFVNETGTQTDVSLVRRFDDWSYKGDGIKRRMPWINTGGLNPYKMHPVLTTASRSEWWGTLVTHHTYTRHNHSPWHNPNVYHSGTMLYWMREVALP